MKSEVISKGWAIVKNDQTIEVTTWVPDEYFGPLEQLPLSSARFTYETLHLSPIRKKNSSSNSLGSPHAHVLHTNYHPAKNRFDLAAFSTSGCGRNQCTDKPAPYSEKPQKDKFLNAKRIHHYPRGGGFMIAHRNTPKVPDEMNFLQTLSLVSARGVDFQSGDGFVSDPEGRVIDIEDERIGGLGDVILFDDRITQWVIETPIMCFL